MCIITTNVYACGCEEDDIDYCQTYFNYGPGHCGQLEVRHQFSTRCADCSTRSSMSSRRRSSSRSGGRPSSRSSDLAPPPIMRNLRDSFSSSSSGRSSTSSRRSSIHMPSPEYNHRPGSQFDYRTGHPDRRPSIFGGYDDMVRRVREYSPRSTPSTPSLVYSSDSDDDAHQDCNCHGPGNQSPHNSNRSSSRSRESTPIRSILRNGRTKSNSTADYRRRRSPTPVRRSRSPARRR